MGELKKWNMLIFLNRYKIINIIFLVVYWWVKIKYFKKIICYYKFNVMVEVDIIIDIFFFVIIGYYWFNEIMCFF